MEMPLPNLLVQRAVLDMKAVRASPRCSVIAHAEESIRHEVADWLRQHKIDRSYIDLTAYGAQAIQLEMRLYVLTPAELYRLVAQEAERLASGNPGPLLPPNCTP